MRAWPRILVLGGSADAGSAAARLAALAAKRLALSETAPALISLADFALPLYDEAYAPGLPVAAAALARLFAAHQGIMIVTPEHNASVPARLKSALDWTARARAPGVARDRAFAIAGAAEGDGAGPRARAQRAAAHLRDILALGLEASVLDETLIVAGTAAFDERGELRDAEAGATLGRILRRLGDEAARHG